MLSHDGAIKKIHEKYVVFVSTLYITYIYINYLVYICAVLEIPKHQQGVWMRIYDLKFVYL